jgi:hypothetical protein
MKKKQRRNIFNFKIISKIRFNNKYFRKVFTNTKLIILAITEVYNTEYSQLFTE